MEIRNNMRKMKGVVRTEKAQDALDFVRVFLLPSPVLL